MPGGGKEQLVVPAIDPNPGNVVVLQISRGISLSGDGIHDEFPVHIYAQKLVG